MSPATYNVPQAVRARWIWLTLLFFAGLGGCTTLKPTQGQIDCTHPAMRCHEGRFGVSYQLQRADGIEEDAIQGTYRWESNRADGGPIAVANLTLSTVLGNSLALVEQNGGRLLLTDSKGRQHRARDWDALFFELFQLRLPGQAIALWMAQGAPTQSQLPALPAPWVWDVKPRRVRIAYQGADGYIRVDLLPAGAP